MTQGTQTPQRWSKVKYGEGSRAACYLGLERAAYGPMPEWILDTILKALTQATAHQQRIEALEAALRKATTRFGQQACGCSASNHSNGCDYRENPTAFKAGPTLHLVGCTKNQCHPKCPHAALLSPSEAI